MRAGTVPALCLALAGCLAACEPRPSSQETLTEVCRPDGVPAARLGIGPLEVPHDQLVARLSHVELTAEYGIAIRLSEEYALALTQLTRESLNQPLELRLGDTVLAEPIVRTPILDGRILISGNFTRLAASEIVAQLSAPCPPRRTESD